MQLFLDTQSLFQGQFDLVSKIVSPDISFNEIVHSKREGF